MLSSLSAAGSRQLRWHSGTGQHTFEELQSVDTAVLVCDGSLGRACNADKRLLELAAESLAAAGSVVLLAVVNCHPELKYGPLLYCTPLLADRLVTCHT